MKLYKKTELKNSRIFFDKNPPAFLTVFIISVAIGLVLVFVASHYITKPYIIKTQGVITTEDNQLVAPQMDGEVVSINVNEGEYVSEGEVLFVISNGQEGVATSALTKQIEELNKQLEILDRYEQSLNTKTNLMKNEGLEQEYYGKVEYYLMQLENEEFNETSAKNDLNEKMKKRSSLEAEIDSLKNQLSEIDKEIADEEAKIESQPADTSTLDELYTEKAEIQAAIDSKTLELQTLDIEIEQMKVQLKDPKSQSEEVYNQLIIELGQKRSQIEAQLIELNGQLSIQEGQDSAMYVKSKNSGYVHYLVPIEIGMGVQRNQVIAEVSNNESSDFKVVSYIPAQDISKVSVGDSVNVALAGVNSQKYGTLKGEVTAIDSGTVTQETEKGTEVFYRCEIQLENHVLTASDGTTVEAVKSMPVEARIVYDEETYLEWILETLNFRQ